MADTHTNWNNLTLINCEHKDLLYLTLILKLPRQDKPEVLNACSITEIKEPKNPIN